MEKATKVLDWVAPVLVGVGVALALEAVQTSDADASVGARAVVFGLALGIVFNRRAARCATSPRSPRPSWPARRRTRWTA